MILSRNCVKSCGRGGRIRDLLHKLILKKSHEVRSGDFEDHGRRGESFREARVPLWSRGNIVATHLVGPDSIPVGSDFLVEVFSGVFLQM